MRIHLPPLLRASHSDEIPSPRLGRRGERAAARYGDTAARTARQLALDERDYAYDRRGTAATLRALDEEHGGGFFAIDEEATLDRDAADVVFAGDAPVIDVQTHLVDPDRWRGAHAVALGNFLRRVDPDRWDGAIDPERISGAAWAALVFGASETAVALLTSTPGAGDENVLTNRQIASVRDVIDRYAGSGRVLTHTIVHPNLAGEIDAMARWSTELRPSGWKVYPLAGAATRAAPGGGWWLDDDEIGGAFLERARTLGPRIVCAHKGLGGPVAGASVATASPRDIGPAARAFPDIDFVVYHSGYEIDPDREEAAYDPIAARGVDRLVRSVAAAGLGPEDNVYAELGSTWFLMLRRPREAAHVLGKLLLALGPKRILWGTDSTWYGTPQPLIDAFRSFRIPASMQAAFGYPPLTRELAAQILSHNARRLYGIDVSHLGSSDDDRAWAARAGPALRTAIAAAR